MSKDDEEDTGVLELMDRLASDKDAFDAAKAVLERDMGEGLKPMMARAADLATKMGYAIAGEPAGLQGVVLGILAARYLAAHAEEVRGKITTAWMQTTRAAIKVEDVEVKPGQFYTDPFVPKEKQ